MARWSPFLTVAGGWLGSAKGTVERTVEETGEETGEVTGEEIDEGPDEGPAEGEELLSLNELAGVHTYSLSFSLPHTRAHTISLGVQ